MDQSINALIVDDNMLFSSLMEIYLTMLGITSKVTSNGIEALQMLENEHFDFMITDLQMPRMNGLTLLNEISKDGKLSLLKTILVTGGGKSVEELNQAKQLADQYIIKPFTLEALKEKVKQLNLESLS